MENDLDLESQSLQPSLSSELGRTAAKNAVGTVVTFGMMALMSWTVRKVRERKSTETPTQDNEE